jgi:hypothetical protein
MVPRETMGFWRITRRAFELKRNAARKFSSLPHVSADDLCQPLASQLDHLLQRTLLDRAQHGLRRLCHWDDLFAYSVRAD